MGKRERELAEHKKRTRMLGVARDRTLGITAAANAALPAVIGNIDAFAQMKKAVAISPQFMAEVAYEIGIAMEGAGTAVFRHILETMVAKDAGSKEEEGDETEGEGPVDGQAGEPGKPEGLGEDSGRSPVILAP